MLVELIKKIGNWLKSKTLGNTGILLVPKLVPTSKKSVLTKVIGTNIGTNSKSVTELLNKIYPVNTEGIKNIKNDPFLGGVELSTNNYMEFSNFILENSDGKKIPTVKILEEKFNLGSKKIKEYKKLMELEGMLLKETPTTYIINPAWKL
jgi:hypothetical protein